ncbi:MAG: RimK family alpha-L-glutamate ligase [Planctomycetaceae bacterium]
MRIPILSARSGWHVDELRRAFGERDHEAIEVRYEAIVGRYGRRRGIASGNVSLVDAPTVLARIIPDGSLEQLIVRVDALHALEERGVSVFNPAAAIERTVDKSWTTALLDAADLPTPETVVCEEVDAAMEAFRSMSDVIVKPLFGSMGLGMLRLREEEAAWRVFRTIERIRGVFYIQRTIEHGGRDVRAFVLGDRVLAAIERRSSGWCTSVARGAEPVAVTLNAEQERIALAATRAVGAEYAGVDLITGPDGTIYVIEVNGIPGWRGLQQATGLDVAGAIADHVLRRLP